MKAYAIYESKNNSCRFIVKRWNGSVKYMDYNNSLSSWHKPNLEFMLFFPLIMGKELKKIKNINRKELFVELL